MEFWNQFIENVHLNLIYSLIVLVAVNVVFGIVLAIRDKDLKFTMLADFVAKRVIPYIFGYVGAVAVSAIPGMPDYIIALPATIYAFVLATMLAKLYEQLQGLGLPLPDLPIQKKPTS
jgi:hypothetical protein